MGTVPKSQRETKKRHDFPVVIVVGGSRALADQCADASRRLGAVVKEVEVASLATEVARHLPFAVVMPQALYEFDQEEFDALASDVRTRVVVVPAEGITNERMQEFLVDAALLSETRRKDG